MIASNQSVVLAVLYPFVTYLYLVIVPEQITGRFGIDYDRYSYWLYLAGASGYATVIWYGEAATTPVSFAYWYPVFALIGFGAYRLDRTVVGLFGHRLTYPTDRIAALLPVLATPIAEELIFRLYLSPLREVTTLSGYVILSALLFGFHHLPYGFREAVLKTANGVLYAMLFVVTGSILAPILAHAGYNFALLWGSIRAR